MKNYARIGRKPGRPAYRTPSRFIARAAMRNERPVSTRNQAKRFERKGRGK